jgi:hypothetical protein
VVGTGPLLIYSRDSGSATMTEHFTFAAHALSTNSAEEPASVNRLNLVRTELSAKLHSIDETSLISPHKHQIYDIVKDIVGQPDDGSGETKQSNWDAIYRAESLLALLYSGEQLRQELGASLQELKELNKAAADAFRPDCAELVNDPGGCPVPAPNDTRWNTCLQRLMGAIHWNKNKQYLLRELHAEATRQILWFIFGSALLVIVPYIVYIIYSAIYGADGGGTWWWELLPLWAALTAGLFGAFFFRLTDIKNRTAGMSVEQAALQRKLPYTLFRAGVGVCGALVVYFFLRSGILGSGSLVPNFENIEIGVHGKMNVAAPSTDLALLTFWCFLAGFSEKLVPSIISGGEEKLPVTASPG